MCHQTEVRATNRIEKSMSKEEQLEWVCNAQTMIAKRKEWMVVRKSAFLIKVKSVLLKVSHQVWTVIKLPMLSFMFLLNFFFCLHAGQKNPNQNKRNRKTQANRKKS